MVKRKLILFLFLLSGLSVMAQEADVIKKEAILRRETSGYGEFRTNGWGFGYRFGKFKTGYSLKSWDFSFSVVKDLKQIKFGFQDNLFSNRIYYGKQIHFYNFKVLRGTQKTLSTKPYWGGVEFRRIFHVGANMGIGVPIWVYIYNLGDNNNDLLVPFDPAKHDRQDIRSKGPFIKGLPDLQFYPALSFRYALNAEYGIYSEVSKSIEVGVQLDIYPIPVQIMAYKNPSYILGSAYVAFHFGRRFNP
jgi:hypothetical protein